MIDFIYSLSSSFPDLGFLVYFLVLFSVFGEILFGIGFIFPGSIIVFLISFFAAQYNLSPGLILSFAFLGGITGSCVNYYLGEKYIGKFSQEKKIFGTFKIFSKVDSIVSTNVFKAFVLGRFVPGIKELAPFIAGGSRISFKKFFLYSSLGNALWVSIFIGVPYIFSYSLEMSKSVLDTLNYFFINILLVFSIIGVSQYVILEYGKTSIGLFLRTLSFLRSLFLSDENVKKFLQRYPQSISWIKNRFRKDIFTGIPLSILVILLLYVFSVFSGMIQKLHDSQLSTTLDDTLVAFFYAIQNKMGVEIFLWVTSLVRGEILVLFFVCLSIFLYIKRQKNEIIILFFSLLGATLFVYLLKDFFEIQRPLYPVYREESYSFPSGHSTLATLFYGYICYLAVKSTNFWKTKIWYIFFTLLVISSIGFSRLYLGVHYISDVTGGVFLGSIWLLGAIGMTQFLSYKNNNETKMFHKKYHKIIGFFLFMLSFSGFIGFFTMFPYQLSEKYIGDYSSEVQKIDDIFTHSDTKYSQTFFGENAENIHFIFLADSDSVLEKAFMNSGWSNSDGYNWDSFKKTISNVLFATPYDTAPMTPLFWNKTTQTFGYQILPDIKNLRYRHHIRIWKTGYTYNQQHIYVGVGVLDTDIKWHLIHKIDPDINAERDYIYTTLFQNNVIHASVKRDFVPAYESKNVFGDSFFSDGKLYEVYLQENSKDF